MRAPGGVDFNCDVVEPPRGPRRQEVRGRSAVRAPGTAWLPRGEIAGGAEEEVGWYDLRRHPARRGGGAGGGGGGGGVEQLLLDSEEEEPTAMSRQPRDERDYVSSCETPRDLRDLRNRDFRDFRNGREIREGHDRHYRDEYSEYDHHPGPATTAVLGNAVSDSFFSSRDGLFMH